MQHNAEVGLFTKPSTFHNLSAIIGEKVTKHSHNYIETYDGLVGLGLDRETDENTIIYYLQKFSDDILILELAKRLTDNELEEIFSLLTRLLKKHLKDSEYHNLFLKDDHP